ncbi:MAG: glycosyltransferase family 2 protein, partial [Patescibacteria group bacterium]
FFLTTRTAIERVGMLDEDYFMYGEDLDWAYRMKQAGLSIWFNPSASVLHRKKQSGRQHEDPAIRRATERHFYETMKLFYQKHYAKRYGWVVTQLIVFGIRLKSLL